MTLLLWIVRVLILLLIIRFVVVMVRQALGSGKSGAARSRAPRRPPERIGGTLVQDPECGTYLPKDRALVVTTGSSVQYFCSAKCRDAWSRKAS